jgi:uncharacterized RDD family membrane protein YckC
VSDAGETVREVVTPEGVPLRFAVAGAGDRLGAFAVDGIVLVGAALGLALVAAAAAFAMRGVGLAAGLVAFFLLRTFYFTWFECRPAGATPGKRLLGLRVIDAHGGTLTPEAVFTRNFMREIELFAPLALALGPEAVLPGHPGWVRLAGSAWLFVFSAMPLFNRDRLRVGDLVAGTLVVRAPRAVLLEDLSAAPARGPRASAPLAFSPAQLDLYGIRELQVLEALLRERTSRGQALEAVARRIQRKIGWRVPGGPVDARAFLLAFYTAQRARLEQRLLLGDRRETKRSGPSSASRRP